MSFWTLLLLLSGLAAPLWAQAPGVGRIDTLPPTAQINVSSGTYRELLTVRINASEPGAVYYTTDGSAPTEQSPKYSGLISISTEGETVLRFFAVDLVGNRSPEYRNTYFLDTRPPKLTLSPTGGRFGAKVKVSLLATEAADIYYTLDGSVPQKGSPPYKGPFFIAVTCTLKALAVDKAGNPGEAVAAGFVIDQNVPVVQPDRPAGLFAEPFRLSLTSSPGVKIYFSFDEFAPLTSYEPYRNAIVIKPGQTVLSYFGENQVGTRSDVDKGIYTVDIFPPKVLAVAKMDQGRRKVFLRANEKADFFYTLDGSQPTAAAKRYTDPIPLPKEGVTLLKVFARDPVGNTADDFVQKFSYDTLAPKISLRPPPGLYNKPFKVELLPSEKSSLFYTLDNTLPTRSSAVYSEPISISRDGRTVLSFIAVDQSDNGSELFSVNYLLDQTPPKVTAKIERDKEGKGFSISFEMDEPGALYYAVGGADPTPLSPKFAAPFKVGAGQKLKYLATDLAGNATPVRDLSEIAIPHVTATPAGGTFREVVRVTLASNLPGTVYCRVSSKRRNKESFAPYGDPILLKANGLFRVEYYVVDQLGIQSTINEESYYIDLFPPEIKVFTQRNFVDSTVTVHFVANENVSISYTTDGTNPLSSPTANIIANKYYTSKDKAVFKQSKDLLISFIAEDIAGNKSELYRLDVNLPTVIPSIPEGKYNKILNVALTTYNEATIYYSLDGSAPTEASFEYRAPVSIVRTTVLKYFAIDKYGYRGKVRESRFEIDLPPRPDFFLEAPRAMEGGTLSFNAKNSVDEESEASELAFRWDFDADGTWEVDFSSSPKGLHVFSSPGRKRVRLEVRDKAGLTASLTKIFEVIKNCPKDMVALTPGTSAFCIDRYEFPNRKGEAPMTGVTWVEAVMNCRNAGKDLCRASEWEFACRGAGGANYPYDATYAPGRCNSEGTELLPGGARSDCKSDRGVYDLTGNAWEWIFDRREGYNLIAGGNFQYGENARCDAAFPNLLSAKAADIGFRCCKR